MKALKWDLLLWWVVANTLGAVIGTFLAEALTGGIYDVSYSSDEFGLWRAAAAGLVFGASIGLIEWLVLRRYLPGVFMWVIATAVGWSLAFGISNYLAEELTRVARIPVEAVLRDVLVAITLGTIVGFTQSIVLGRRASRSEFWVLANCLALVTVAVMIRPVDSAIEGLNLPTIEMLPELLSWSRILEVIWIFGVLELTTGLTLFWLLGQRAVGLEAVEG